MHFLEQFNFKTLKYDFYNKFNYKNTKELPKLKKIILNFGCKTTELKQLATSLLALELITKKKGKLTTAKNPHLLLKIRKGNPIGCKVTLTKKSMFLFLERIITEIFPKTKNFHEFKINSKYNTFSYELKETLNFNELEEQYSLFNNLPKLNITFVTNSKTNKELIFILKSYQFPIR